MKEVCGNPPGISARNIWLSFNMEKKVFETTGTCSKLIEFELDGNIVKSVKFIGGCAGNTAGVAKLVEGMNAQEVIKRLKGIDCHGKGTSCPDQLARALEEAIS